MGEHGHFGMMFGSPPGVPGGGITGVLPPPTGGAAMPGSTPAGGQMMPFERASRSPRSMLPVVSPGVAGNAPRRAGILRGTRTRGLRHYRRPDNAPWLRRFLVQRGPGRADEMGGDRSPAPCGGTWGCAAPRDELGATRNCSGPGGGERAHPTSREFAVSVSIFGAKSSESRGRIAAWTRELTVRARLAKGSVDRRVRAVGPLCQFDPKFCHGKQGGTVLIRHRLCQVLTFLCVSPVGLRVVSHHWPFPT